MSNKLVAGLWTAVGALKGQLQDTFMGTILGFISDALLYITNKADDDAIYHIVSVSILFKRYENFLRDYVANTVSDIDDKVLDELFEAVDEILKSDSQE